MQLSSLYTELRWEGPIASASHVLRRDVACPGRPLTSPNAAAAHSDLGYHCSQRMLCHLQPFLILSLDAVRHSFAQIFHCWPSILINSKNMNTSKIQIKVKIWIINDRLGVKHCTMLFIYYILLILRKIPDMSVTSILHLNKLNFWEVKSVSQFSQSVKNGAEVWLSLVDPEHHCVCEPVCLPREGLCAGFMMGLPCDQWPVPAVTWSHCRSF